MISMTQTTAATQALDPTIVTAKKLKAEGQAKTSLFGHALDAVNPLQHVPGVAQGYRAITGDKISKVPQLIGHVGIGAAVGGPIGAAVGAGVFLIERGLPMLFKGIGKLFGGGRDPAKEAAGLTRHLEAPKPPAEPQRITSAIAPAKGAWPQLSNDQFAAILQAFPGATLQAQDSKQPAAEQKERPIIAEPLPMTADVAAQMRANLAKYDAMKLKADAERAQAATR